MVRASRCAQVLVLVSLLLSTAGCSVVGDRVASVQLGLRPAPRTPQAEATSAAVPATLGKHLPRVAAVDPSERFDTDLAMTEAAKIASFGVRSAGSEEEMQASLYIERRLREMGFEPTVQTFKLPNGRTSRNVIVSVDGYSSKRVLIIGAHVDSKPPSPGANDNGSGVGILLELARLLRASPAAGRVELVFYGSEEIIDRSRPEGHHFGSRHHARSLPRSVRDNVAGMISVDMVGYGTRFQVQTMRRGPQSLSDLLLAMARDKGVSLSFKKDMGPTGWSDHEPYELAGIPAVWLHWQDDPLYHQPGDDAGHLQRRPVDVTGRFVLAAIRSLDAARLESLCRR